MWNRGFERWQFIWGGYWLNFALTIILSILFIVLFVVSCIFSVRKNYTFSIMGLKVILAIVAFFVMWYCIMVIILMAGQAALATFCYVLGQVNQGNLDILDKIPFTFRNYNKLIIRECTAGPDGDLFKYSYMFQDGLHYDYNYDLRTVYPGFINYQKFLAMYPSATLAPSFALLFANYTAIMKGNQEDYPAVFNSAEVIMYLMGNTNSVKVGDCNTGSTCSSIYAN